MSRGVLVFAHNNGIIDYVKMASITASRVRRFLKLPTTLVTDSLSLENNNHDTTIFDKIVLVDVEQDNHIRNEPWYNKGRYLCYEHTPYDETLVIDTDYVINSTALLKTFQLPSDFVCYRTAKYMFDDAHPHETMGNLSLQTYWATVIRFRKTERVEHIFSMMERVQDHYSYYAELHNMNDNETYRNDYALTIALRTVNGHLELEEDFIPGNLIHVDRDIKVNSIGNSDTRYRMIKSGKNTPTKRANFIVVDDFDFHMMNKTNFLELLGDE
jgi:hypothetical protein